jgi:hypothetical protein
MPYIMQNRTIKKIFWEKEVGINKRGSGMKKKTKDYEGNLLV